MRVARDLLIAAVAEQRPIILLLGQDAWAKPRREDPILVKALDRLGRSSEAQRGWPGVLGISPVDSDFWEWLAERFERRVHPAWLSVLGELPWSAVYTSSLDPTLKKVLQNRGREPEAVLTASETPRAIRSRARPPLYYLFGQAGSLDPQGRPPADRNELNARRIGHALRNFSHILDAATALGLVVVDGFISGRDWLKLEDILGATGRAAPEQVLWFGGPPQLGAEDTADFNAALATGRIVVESERLGTVVAELRVLGRLPDFMPPESEDAGFVSFKRGGRLETTPEERLRVEAVASIVDDAWTAHLSPLGPDTEYDTFRRFHGDVGGPRLLVEGVRRGFAIERDFERRLLREVGVAITNHASIRAPIIVHGQSGTGKSIALARVVAQIRQKKTAAVLYAIGRVPQSQEISGFCEAAENAGAEVTLIVSDANRDIDPYRDLLMSMRSQGRRVVVLGSRYRIVDDASRQSSLTIEAPNELSQDERKKIVDLLERFKIVDLLERFLTEPSDPSIFSDAHILAFLYRFLPLSRQRISAGLGLETRAVEQEIHLRGRHIPHSPPDTQFAQKLVEAGFANGYRPLFDDEQQSETLEAEDAASRIIDLVMVAGSLSCPVPINLLLRAVTENLPGVELSLITEMFRGLDLFRWKWANEERSELLVLPRLTLEADLICRRRLGSSEKEFERLIELVGAVRGAGTDIDQEHRFLLTLLQQIGDDGPRGSRYRRHYVEIARTLTRLRQRFAVIHPSLMLQESVFRRIAVRKDVVDNIDRVPLLEEARDAVQIALDGIADGTIRSAKRTRRNLQVERASLYGFLAYDCAKRAASPEEVWSSYEAARTAIHQAVSVTDNYYPVDIGLWTPADILEMANLTEMQKAEIEADIYATLYHVDPELLSQKQSEKFNIRQMKVGRILRNRSLSEDAYTALEASGSTAGYFLRARELAPDFNTFNQFTVETSASEDIVNARRAAQFLQSRFDRIEDDERCLSLLLECQWFAEMGRRPLRGQRQPLPASGAARRDLHAIVCALNNASGNATRHVTRYLEAVLGWVLGDEASAIQTFRELGRDTEYEDPSRVIRRHVIADADGNPLSFNGRVERERSKGHWVIRVDGLKQTVDLLNRDDEDIAYGRPIKRFAIAFNFIGPIADLIDRRR